MTKSPDTPESQRQPTPSAVAPCSASDLIDTLDMMRDEFQRIIACPGCNAEIEDLANRAQLKLVQCVPVIAQRDRAEAEVSRLRSELQRLAYMAPDLEAQRFPRGWLRTRIDAILKPNTKISHAEDKL